MNQNKKKIMISVTNDLVTDQRVYKVSKSLVNNGYTVILVGRKLKNSLPVKPEFKSKRFRLVFKKKVLFYAEYNIRLFLFLLFSDADIYLSNDLDTLPACYLASRIKRKIIVYDSHEYFTDVPELVDRKKVQRIWERIERKLLPKIKHTYTVCDSIADIYHKKYGINMNVVRNIPSKEKPAELYTPELFHGFDAKRIILYQGSVNIGRGIEQAIRAMEFIQNAVLLIIGDGDIKKDLEHLASELKLQEKIIFTGKIPFDQLYSYTKRAHIGLTIEENIGMNYYYALPNKLFDYIRAGVPVLASRLPEIEKIVSAFDIGCFIEDHAPGHIAEKINGMLDSPDLLIRWKNNLKIASDELSWENEEKILMSVFNTINLK
jgi:glycosyltransferase involved in cell wall biosynthesis